MSAAASKKDFLKNNPLFQRVKKSTSSELETVRHEKTQLETQNRALKSEVQDLMVRNNNLINALNVNKLEFVEEFNKLQKDIKQNEKQLLENSKKCLEQQKKYSEEIKKLKMENENLKKSKADTENSLNEKLKGLESEIKLLKLENENLKSQNKEEVDKCMKYKAKLRHAVKIVNEMNSIVVQYRNKPEIACEMTQTEFENSGEKATIQDCFQCGDPRYKRDLNSENLMLSDIFFKPKSFLDSEIDLFTVKSKSKVSSRTRM